MNDLKLDLLEKLLSITQELVFDACDQNSHERRREWQEISAKVADLREQEE